MKLRPWNIILFTGLLWFTAGFFLTLKGLKLIIFTMPGSAFSKVLGSSEQASLLLIAFSLLIGFAKGRFVMIKTINRLVKHLLALPLPLQVSKLYPKSYLFLLLGMFSLAFLFKVLPIPKV